MLPYLLAFGVSALTELIYVYYVISAARGNVAGAVIASGVLSQIGSRLTQSYVSNPELINAIMIGEMLGTFLALTLAHRNSFKE